MTDERQTKNAASEGTSESPCSVPPGFADYWASKWPGQTRNHAILARSAHYQGCRDAWESALKWSGYYETQDAKREPNTGISGGGTPWTLSKTTLAPCSESPIFKECGSPNLENEIKKAQMIKFKECLTTEIDVRKHNKPEGENNGNGEIARRKIDGISGSKTNRV